MFDWQKENRRIVTSFDKLATRLRRWSHWRVQSGSLQADPLCFGLLANYFPTFGADFLDHVIDPVEQYVMFVYFHPLLVFNRLGEP